MDNWQLLPYDGLGELKFSQTRENIRSILGRACRLFKKTPQSNLSDVYDKYGLHLYYDSHDMLEFIESYQPCRPFYEQVSILNRNVKKVISDISKLGYTERFDSGSYFFDDLGLALYAPASHVEAASMYKRGYYDKRVDL